MRAAAVAVRRLWAGPRGREVIVWQRNSDTSLHCHWRGMCGILCIMAANVSPPFTAWQCVLGAQAVPQEHTYVRQRPVQQCHVPPLPLAM
jgi:hypothetical protein